MRFSCIAVEVHANTCRDYCTDPITVRVHAENNRVFTAHSTVSDLHNVGNRPLLKLLQTQREHGPWARPRFRTNQKSQAFLKKLQRFPHAKNISCCHWYQGVAHSALWWPLSERSRQLPSYRDTRDRSPKTKCSQVAFAASPWFHISRVYSGANPLRF